jgi:hypothetical protein
MLVLGILETQIFCGLKRPQMASQMAGRGYGKKIFDATIELFS